jgi:hypothetical protein
MAQKQSYAFDNAREIQQERLRTLEALSVVAPLLMAAWAAAPRSDSLSVRSRNGRHDADHA